MNHCIARQRVPCLPLAVLCAAFVLSLSLSGCGGAVTNLLPGANKPVTGVPAGPTLGYVFSSTDGTLRALLGVRGSAQVSASIVPAGVYVAGEASTAGSVALLEDANGSLFAFDLPLSQPMHVTDGLPANARVVFAPAGQNAVVYAPGGTSLLMVSGLPGNPQVQTRTSAGPLVLAAVSDAGTVAIVQQGSPVRVGTLSAAGTFSAVASVQAAGGISFMPGVDNLLIADSGANTAALVRSVAGAPSVQALSVTGSGVGLSQPVAIAGSYDGHWAVIADGGDQNVFRVDLTTGTPAAMLTCACQPTAVSALTGGGTFRVNGIYGGPLWTVDTTSAQPQLLFVPAIAKGSP
jgi:hypothetical protein